MGIPIPVMDKRAVNIEYIIKFTMKNGIVYSFIISIHLLSVRILSKSPLYSFMNLKSLIIAIIYITVIGIIDKTQGLKNSRLKLEWVGLILK